MNKFQENYYKKATYPYEYVANQLLNKLKLSSAKEASITKKSKIMKKVKIFMALALVVVTFFSCEKDGLESNVIAKNSATELFWTKDGILCFKDQKSYEKTVQMLSQQSFDELSVWESSIGFESIERASSDIMQAIVCRADDFVANGYSQDDVIKKFNSGEIPELLPEIEQEINYLRLKYEKDEDGLRFLDYQFNVPVSYRTLNRDYSIVIADTLYKYFDNRVELYPGFSKNKDSVEPIIGYKSAIGNGINMEKSVPTTYTKRFCFDERIAGNKKHKLRVDLYAERYIFQKAGCNSNCVYTKAKVYLVYQGYYKGWFGWYTGNYDITINGAFDVAYERLGVANSLRREIPQTTIYSSPYSLYRLPYDINGAEDEPSSNYPYIAFGNVDCFTMIMGDISCSFLQANGINGILAGHGYLQMDYFYNAY